MKKLVVGMLLGAAMMGTFMNAKNIELTHQIESQQIEMNRMGNEIGALKMTINTLKVENGQLSESIK